VTNEFNFGDDPHHYPDPGVRSGHVPDPGRTATLSTHREQNALQKSFSNSIMLAFGGGLCSLSTSSLFLVYFLYVCAGVCMRVLGRMKMYTKVL